MKYSIKSILIISVILLSHKANSQEEEIRLAQDILFLADEFASPAASGAAYQAGAGWFTSAQSLDPWKFEVSVHANGLIVPSSKKTSSVSESNFQILEIENGSSVQIPTAFGEKTDINFVGYKDEVIPALDGVDKGLIPHPFVQITMGLPFESEFTVRALPEMTIDDVNFSTYGAGIKHNFSQYFMFNEPEDLQVSALITYSKFEANYAFDPINIQDFAVLELIEVDGDLWLFEALASKRYENFEIFGALGATNSNFAYAMDGSGPFLGNINTALETLGEDELQFKGDIGFNLYFNKFKWSTMVTAGKFFNINLGLHFRI
ncbi:MAG TPA: DUF6588 family protein [Salegentibacter sp.]|uniref:DUF6588 family protein n=1 Tax=Salegentibacter sp. TaxID=1903072 RepID=UPI002F951A9F